MKFPTTLLLACCLHNEAVGHRRKLTAGGAMNEAYASSFVIKRVLPTSRVISIKLQLIRYEQTAYYIPYNFAFNFEIAGLRILPESDENSWSRRPFRPIFAAKPYTVSNLSQKTFRRELNYRV